MRTATARDLVAIGALALVLRAAWTLLYGRVEAGPHDARFFEVTARHLAEGYGYTQLFGTATAHAPPGFPFLVSIAYRALGTHVKLGLALNVVLGTATALLLYLIAREAMGRAAGRVAGLAFAILPVPIFFTGLFLSETTFIFMLVGFLALAVFLPDRPWTPVALGAAAGLAALTKGEGALLPVIPLAMWWAGRVRGAWLRRAAPLLAAMALTILPWTIRNAIEMNSFVPVATNASTALWPAHNSEANGGPMDLPPSLLARIPKGLGHTEREVEQARLLRRDAAHWAIRNPQKELGLIPRRVIALGEPSSGVFDIWFDAPAAYQVGSSSKVVFGVLADAFDYLLMLLTLAALALLGVRRLWRLHPVLRGALAYLATSLLLYGIVYYGQFRYRLVMEPMMILVSAPLIVAVWQARGALQEVR